MIGIFDSGSDPCCAPLSWQKSIFHDTLLAMRFVSIRRAVVLPVLCSLAFGGLIHSVPHAHGSTHDHELADAYVLPPDLRGGNVTHTHSEPIEEESGNESIAWQYLHNSLAHENKKEILSMDSGVPSHDARPLVFAYQPAVSQPAWFLQPDLWTDTSAQSFVTDGISKDRRFL